MGVGIFQNIGALAALLQFSHYNSFMHPFSRLEARMEALVEGTLARLFANRLHPRDIGVQLARALEDSAATGQPATHYAVYLNPADAQTLSAQTPTLAQQLADDLLRLAREAQISLAHTPVIALDTDPALPPHRVRVVGTTPHPAPGQTQTLTPARPATAPLAPRAYVIVNGERLIPLTLSVVNVGRRLDNQLVIDDHRVSRVHAQLRLRFGRYVLYDLNSSVGTFVNSARVQECVLRPGDVISLGGLPLIYGEDEPGDNGSRKSEATQPNVVDEP
jgi:pSer/pThr/pTyr-binding forkhead associated (FHA) protein